MIICLEGPDGAGKSTVAEWLWQQLRARGDSATIVKRGPLHGRDSLEEYVADLWRLAGEYQHVVMDRWHPGELLYPDLLRDEASALSAAQVRHIELLFDRMGVVKVVVTADVEVLQSRVAERGDDLVGVDQLPAIHSFYEAYAKAEGWYRLTDTSPAALWSILMEGVTRTAITQDLTPFTTYVGPRWPKYLLLGDVRNDDRFPSAFVPVDNTSGSYLLTALEENGFRDYGIANACDVDDPKALWETLGQPKVAALGSKAARRLKRVGVPFVPHMHPQYVRRFEFNRLDAYAQLIKESMLDDR